MPALRKPSRRKPGPKKPGPKKPGPKKPDRTPARPFFRPRVIVKFQDWVDVPYEDGAERHLVEKYGDAGWARLRARYGELTLQRLYTALPEDRIRALVDEATERDERYRPRNFFSWFTIDAPAEVRSEELARELLAWELVETAYPDARPIDPMAVFPDDDPRRPNQGYLDPAPDGIDAEFAWTVAGGDGAGQRVIDLEQGWTLDHEDLGDKGGTLLFGTLVDGSRAHGTAVLGEICAVDNTIGCIGITPNIDSVDVVSHSGSFSNVSDAILAAVATMDFGHVLLLEMQTVTPAAPVFGAPIELIDDIFETIRLATALGIVVVEAGGNGSNNLDTVSNVAGLQVLNPTSADFRDSGAIVVGAASSAAPHTRMSFSSFGARVDCYAWGENVDTTSSNASGSTTLYTGAFGGTSSASPIIAGAALAIQGIREAAGTPRLGPLQMRQVLRNPATGTASANPGTDLIGVMPDLASIITTTLDIGFSDVYVRDFPGDTGDPHTGPISASPDVIVRPTPVANPQAAYGEGSGTENSLTLGYEVEAGQDNHIYVRLRNRGDRAAHSVEAMVYWSEVATLVSPDMWSPVGSQTIHVVPPSDQLRVTDAIVWQAADIPATGHYCFVATVGTADDPVPPLANLVDFDNFRAFIRENNNVTWRNFNVVNAVPDPADPGVLMPFLFAGAPDRAVPMGIEVIARLPEGARLRLEAPGAFLKRLGFAPPQLGGGARGQLQLALRPQGRQELGIFAFPARFRARARFVAALPAEAQKMDGWQVIVRQYLARTREEVGRVTWHLVSPEFFQRRRRLEQCLGFE
jgi:serine protease